MCHGLQEFWTGQREWYICTNTFNKTVYGIWVILTVRGKKERIYPDEMIKKYLMMEMLNILDSWTLKDGGKT